MNEITEDMKQRVYSQQRRDLKLIERDVFFTNCVKPVLVILSMLGIIGLCLWIII